MMKRCKRCGVWALVVTVGALGCSSSSSDGGSDIPTQTITIGGVIDQTGSAGPPSWADAAKLAAQQMNTALAKAKSPIRFNLALTDSTNAPAVAVQRAVELVALGAKGIVTDTSQDDVAILKLQYDPDPTKHLNVPIVGLVATSPSINNPATTNPDPLTQTAYQDPEHWNFRTAMSSAAQGLVLARIAMAKAGGTTFKLSAFASSEPFGAGQAAALKGALAKVGPAITMETLKFDTTAHTPNDADYFGGQMLKVLDGRNEETALDDGPPAIWSGLTFPDFLVAMVRGYRLSGSTIPGVHGMGLRNQKVLDSLGSDANGQEGVSYVVVDNTPSGATFATDLTAMTGLPPNSLDAATYDATVTLMLATLIAANGQPDATAVTGAQIRAVMRSTSTPGGQIVRTGVDEFANAAGFIALGTPINYEGAQSPCDYDDNNSVTTRFVHFAIANGAFKDGAVYDCVASPDCVVQQ